MASPPPVADLTAAVAHLKTAYRSALLWSDTVRQDAEQRLNVGPTDARALDDPAYDAALQWCSAIDALRVAGVQVLASAPKT